MHRTKKERTVRNISNWALDKVDFNKKLSTYFGRNISKKKIILCDQKHILSYLLKPTLSIVQVVEGGKPWAHGRYGGEGWREHNGWIFLPDHPVTCTIQV